MQKLARQLVDNKLFAQILDKQITDYHTRFSMCKAEDATQRDYYFLGYKVAMEVKRAAERSLEDVLASQKHFDK